MDYVLARAKQAVQFLVNSSYFQHHVKKLRHAVQKPRSMPFKEQAEVLNELLVIGRQNIKAMENLIKVAEYKRSDRNDYQREYMAAKRRRDAKVIAFEEAVAGKKLSLDARVKALRNQYVVWNKERDALLKSIKSLSWLERNERVKKFWKQKETELESLIKEAHPVRRRRVVEVLREPKTSLGKAMVEAHAKKAAKAVDKRK